MQLREGRNGWAVYLFFVWVYEGESIRASLCAHLIEGIPVGPNLYPLTT
jgi:hypothetical protein